MNFEKIFSNKPLMIAFVIIALISVVREYREKHKNEDYYANIKKLIEDLETKSVISNKKNDKRTNSSPQNRKKEK